MLVVQNYKVVLKKKVVKQIHRLPTYIQLLFDELREDLEEKGPIQVKQSWKNFSKLGKNKYHCHLTPSWVACWYYEKGSIEIEIYYVGSRESAPYD